MDHRIPRVGLVFSIVCAVLGAITFVALNEAFEGPSALDAVRSEPYHLEAVFADTEALPTKQPVLVRGVPVGKVTEVSFDHGTSKATVSFTVSEEFGPVNADAAVSIGERTLLGDPYLNLMPGSEGEGELESGARIRALASVDFDEALDFLDRDGRRHVRSTIDTLGTAAAVPTAGPRPQLHGRRARPRDRRAAPAHRHAARPGAGPRRAGRRFRGRDRRARHARAGASQDRRRRARRARGAGARTPTRSSRGSPSCHACSRRAARRFAAPARCSPRHGRWSASSPTRLPTSPRRSPTSDRSPPTRSRP